MRRSPLVLLLSCLCLAAVRAEPLAARSGPVGATMFALMAPETTGVVTENRYADPRIWMMSLIYFCFVMGQYGLTFWMPTLIKATGVQGNLQIGLLSAIPFGCAVIAMNLFGRSADARRERRWHLVIPAAMGVVGFVIAASFSHNTVMSTAGLSLAAAGVLTCAPLFWSLPTAFLTGTGAAAGIALINSVGNLAGFVSPYLIGTLKDMTHSTQSGMYVLAAALVVGAILVLRTPARLVNR